MFEQGFTDKCAELNADPVKVAQTSNGRVDPEPYRAYSPLSQVINNTPDFMRSGYDAPMNFGQALARTAGAGLRGAGKLVADGASYLGKATSNIRLPKTSNAVFGNATANLRPPKAPPQAAPNMLAGSNPKPVPVASVYR